MEIANSDQGLNNFESQLAFDATAIYDLNSDNIYESDMELAPNALIRRQQSIDTSGSLSEMTFSVAGNFKDFLMVGATIGVPLVRFEEVKNYDEEDAQSARQGERPPGARKAGERDFRLDSSVRRPSRKL